MKRSKKLETPDRRDSVAQRMLDRLEHFARVLESGEPLEKHFTVRRVALPAAPAPWTAAAIKQVRELLGASQVVFARFLGVSPQTVRAWEQGVHRPSEMACRFLDEIRHNPAYWQQRLCELTVTK